MIRTLLSFCLLFGGLLVASKWLHEATGSAAKDATPTDASAAQERSAELPQALPASEKPARLPSSGEDQPAKLRLVAFEDDVQGALKKDKPADGEKAQSEPAESDDDATTPAPGAAAKRDTVEIEMTPELEELRGRIRECLAYYYFRPENVALRSPWGAMHAMIAYGVDSELIVGTKKVNAIGYLCYNGTCNGQQLFYLSNGQLQTRIGPGVQGHPGQFLAMLAQSRVKTTFPIVVEGKQFTVADLIQHEKDTCRPKTELTFKLIAFTHYLKSDEKWKSNDGQEWDIPRVIKEELAQPIVGAACGGTHRMTGFSYAFRKRETRGEEFTGQWRRTRTFVEDYHNYAFKLQNPDGSFSTDWFAGRADFGPPTRRLETTGHITEWLTYSLTRQQLVEPRMTKSVSYLTDLLLNNRNEKWGIGPLGHGLHALALYDERIFGGQPGTRAVELAEVKKPQKAVER